MKTQIVIDLDDSLVEMIGKKEYDTSQYLNQMLWRELVLENDMNYFNNLDKIKFSDTSWEFKSTDTQIDSDFKFLQKIYVKETDQFHSWLNKFSDGYRKNIINTLKRTFEKDYDNFIQSEVNCSYSNKYFSLSLRNLVNYAIERNLMVKSHSVNVKDKLKLRSATFDKRVPKFEEFEELLFSVKKFYSKLDHTFLILLFESGLRTSDLMYFLHNFKEEDVEIREEVVIAPIFNIRGSKQSFYLFATKKTFDIILNNLEYYKSFNVEKLKTYIKRKGLLPLKYIRKLNFTKLIEAEIDFEIANFIQGRASSNIGFNHYLAKKEIGFKRYKKFIDEYCKMHF